MSKQKKTVLIFDINTFPKLFLSKIKKFTNLKIIVIKNEDKSKLFREANNINALINCPRSYFDEKLFKKFKKLEWVHTAGAGVESFLIPSFVNSNVIFTNGKILQGPEVADHAVGLLLSLTRNIKAHILKKKVLRIRRPIELFKKKALVIGYGGIGSNICDRLVGFGMKIDIISEDLPPMNNYINNFFELDKLYNIAKNYDVIISAAPLTKKTYKIFNKFFFNNMKKQSIFINISRGKLVDTTALLNKKIIEKLWGIGLDVTDPEPLSADHSLRKKENVIITDHTAGLSDFNRLRAYDLILTNMKRYSKKEKLFNIVDKINGY